MNRIEKILLSVIPVAAIVVPIYMATNFNIDLDTYNRTLLVIFFAELLEVIYLARHVVKNSKDSKALKIIGLVLFVPYQLVYIWSN